MDVPVAAPAASTRAPPDAPGVVACILNWHGAEDSVRAVASVFAQHGVDVRVLILENGSGADELPLLQESLAAAGYPFRTVTLPRALAGGVGASDPGAIIANDSNDRWAGGVNHLLAVTRATWPTFDVLLLNNDVVLPPGAVASLQGALHAPGAPCPLAAVGPVVLGSDGRVLSRGMAASWWRGGLRNRDMGGEAQLTGGPPPGSTQRVASLEGACLLTSASAATRIGPMDEGFYLYWEDADWCARARAAGFDLAVADDAAVTHGLSRASGGGGNRRTTYWIHVNRWRFIRKHWPAWRRAAFVPWWWLVWLPGTVLALLVAGRRDLARAALAGSWDGLRGHFAGRAFSRV